MTISDKTKTEETGIQTEKVRQTNRCVPFVGTDKNLGLITWNVCRSYGETQWNKVFMLTYFLEKIKFILA